jgi:hypothetical protein
VSDDQIYLLTVNICAAKLTFERAEVSHNTQVAMSQHCATVTTATAAAEYDLLV